MKRLSAATLRKKLKRAEAIIKDLRYKLKWLAEE